LSDAVTFTGYVDDRALRALYARALALVAPSFGEGFGLPLVEAMACGTPIITANLTAMPEVAKDAALTIDPRDLDAMAEAMERVASDSTLRSDLAARGRQRAASYTWERAAREVLRAYREA
jgi:glycosyltransferase involved in cell wall biosynthesis